MTGRPSVRDPRRSSRGGGYGGPSARGRARIIATTRFRTSSGRLGQALITSERSPSDDPGAGLGSHGGPRCPNAVESAGAEGATLVTPCRASVSAASSRFPKPQVGGSTLPGRTTSSERGSAVCPRVKPICSRVRARRSVTPRSWRAGGESPESRPFWSRQDWPLLFSQARNWPRRSCEWFVAESRSELARRLAFEGEGGHREDAEGEARMDEA